MLRFKCICGKGSLREIRADVTTSTEIRGMVDDQLEYGNDMRCIGGRTVAYECDDCGTPLLAKNEPICTEAGLAAFLKALPCNQGPPMQTLFVYIHMHQDQDTNQRRIGSLERLVGKSAEETTNYPSQQLIQLMFQIPGDTAEKLAADIEELVFVDCVERHETWGD